MNYDTYKKTFKEERTDIMEDCRYKYYDASDCEELFECITKFFYECHKRGLKADYRFGKIYVKSKNFDEWCFEPKFGKITLMHKNTNHMIVGEYHKQFCKNIPLKNIVIYIDEHDRAKYTSEIVKFSVMI